MSSTCGDNCYKTSSTFDSSASQSYTAQPYSVNISVNFIQYSGYYAVNGTVGTDNLSVAGMETLAYITSAYYTFGLTDNFPANGVLGLGYSGVSKGPQPLISMLKNSNQISSAIFSLYLNDNIFLKEATSVIIFGGIDETYAYNTTAYPINYIDITANPEGLWTFNLLSVDLNDTNVDANTQIILDSGEDWIVTSASAYPFIVNALLGQGFTSNGFTYTKPKCDNSSGFYYLWLSPSQDQWLQIPPYRLINTAKDSNGQSYCYCILRQGNDENWHIGSALFRTYYSIFDVDNSRFGYTFANITVAPIIINKVSSSSSSFADWKIAVIVVSVVVGIAAIGAIVYFVIKKRRTTKDGNSTIGKPLQEVSLHA